MTAAITLTPGRVTLADWRAVACGAAVQLDPAAMPAIEAGARAVEAIIAGRFCRKLCVAGVWGMVAENGSSGTA